MNGTTVLMIFDHLLQDILRYTWLIITLYDEDTVKLKGTNKKKKYMAIYLYKGRCSLFFFFFFPPYGWDVGQA